MPEDLLLFLTTRTKKMAAWKTTFASEHLAYTQISPNWPSVLHSLHALPVAVLTIPANSAAPANHSKSAKHSRLTLLFVLSNMHTLTLTQMRRCIWNRVVTRGVQFPVRWITASDAEKVQQCHIYVLQYSKFASERSRVRTRGPQTCFLFRAPYKLVTHLVWKPFFTKT